MERPTSVYTEQAVTISAAAVTAADNINVLKQGAY
jgi:hypothetical protein